MTPRFMTDAEREEIAAIEARCKARFQAAYDNMFVYRAASADTRRDGEDATQIAAEFTSGAVAKPDAHTPSP